MGLHAQSVNQLSAGPYPGPTNERGETHPGIGCFSPGAAEKRDQTQSAYHMQPTLIKRWRTFSSLILMSPAALTSALLHFDHLAAIVVDFGHCATSNQW